VIVRGLAYIDGGLVDVDIFVDGEYISKISKYGVLSDDVVYDFGRKGFLILPGMIDIHVHLRDFNYSYKEDFYTGTASAAAGGVCVVCDMPNTDPRVNSLWSLCYRDKVASLHSLVDYGLYYGVPESGDELEGIEGLAVGMKIYPMDLLKDPGLLDTVFRYNAMNGVLTVFHPEDPSDVVRGVRVLESEVRAIDYIISLYKKYGLKTHITHVTSVDSVERLSRFEKVSSDTCPHYLLLSSDKCTSKYFRVTPPLRGEDVRVGLLDAFCKGLIDVYATDHAPHAYWEKVDGDWSGFPGLETALPLLLDMFKKGLISLDMVVDTFSSNPARILGIDDRYGFIREGYLASLTVVDVSCEYRVDPSRFYSKAKHSPFDGWVLNGCVVATFVRGEPIYYGGDIVGRRGWGRNIVREGSAI
jgi:dihydroorotase